MMSELKLGSLLAERNNNLDAVRFLATMLVLVSHAFILSGKNEPGPPFYKNTYGGLGVDIFFIISGFLITGSYLRTKDPIRFLWSRILRVFPALICTVLLCVFVLGPLVTNIPFLAYMTNPGTMSYLGMLTLYDVHYTLPGVFTHNAYPNTVNGSLWTLEYEFTFYLFVLVLGLSRLLDKQRFITALFLLIFILSYFDIGKQSYIYTINIGWALKLFTYFGAGMLAYLYRDLIPLDHRYFVFILGILLIASLKGGFTDSLFVFALGYIVFYIGFTKTVKLSWFSRLGDPSYGIYVYAFPVQQTIVHAFGGSMNPWLNIGLSMGLTVPLGYLSWHLLEKHCLRLKSAISNWYRRAIGGY